MSIDTSFARHVISSIAVIDVARGENGFKLITQQQGEQIASLFDGDFDLFHELDERPGRYGGEFYSGVEGESGYDSWHWKLRQARNATKRFFDILNSKPAAAS
jgi:hypothetical protein